MMVAQMIGFFLSFFSGPSAWGLGLAVVFGAVWLIGYWPPLFKKARLWAVLAGSAVLTLAAVAFIQIPLQFWTGRVLSHFVPLQLGLLTGMQMEIFVAVWALLVTGVALWLRWRKPAQPAESEVSAA